MPPPLVSERITHDAVSALHEVRSCIHLLQAIATGTGNNLLVQKGIIRWLLVAGTEQLAKYVLFREEVIGVILTIFLFAAAPELAQRSVVRSPFPQLTVCSGTSSFLLYIVVLNPERTMLSWRWAAFAESIRETAIVSILAHFCHWKYIWRKLFVIRAGAGFKLANRVVFAAIIMVNAVSVALADTIAIILCRAACFSASSRVAVWLARTILTARLGVHLARLRLMIPTRTLRTTTSTSTVYVPRNVRAPMWAFDIWVFRACVTIYLATLGIG